MNKKKQPQTKPQTNKESKKALSLEKIVPDTSVLIEGILSKKLQQQELTVHTILIHEAALAELEYQANLEKAIGFLGLDEIKRLSVLSKEYGIALTFSGKRPSTYELKQALLGEIDALIRDLAYNEDATLVTADKIQARVAEAKGMKVLFIPLSTEAKKIQLEDFFDQQTMSVHLKENVLPYAKKGVPGSWQFVAITSTLLSQEQIQDISREIIEEAKLRRDGFIEIERPGSTIVQLGSFRIVITKPPFSDGWEITAVRPVKRMTFDEYQLNPALAARIIEQAEGILIAGAPGMGKSTFAQALAEFYANQQKIVKTVEAPRDLILPDAITQYAMSHGDPEEIHDILLLSRPDYTFFDEMRNTADFKLFADLRLAGVGMIGVVHATNPIDAIQRFVGRIELGVIPQVIDTVIFIKNGTVFKTLSLNMTVKVPAGMTEADLSRPVVVVTDFLTKKPEYELYSYGEETVVIPIAEQEISPAQKLARQSIEQELKKYTSNPVVEMKSDHKCIVSVPQRDIATIIGKQGRTITQIEKTLGIHIDVQELEEKPSEGKEQLQFTTKITKKGVQFMFGPKMQHHDIDIYVGGDYLLTAKVGNAGVLHIKKTNKIGKMLQQAITIGDPIGIYRTSAKQTREDQQNRG